MKIDITTLSIGDQIKTVLNENWRRTWTHAELAAALMARGISTTSLATFLSAHSEYFTVSDVPNTGKSFHKTVKAYRLRNQKKIPMGTIVGLYVGRSAKYPKAKKHTVAPVAPRTTGVQTTTAFEVEIVERVENVAISLSAQMRNALQLEKLKVGGAAILKVTDDKTTSLARSVATRAMKNTKLRFRTYIRDDKGVSKLYIERIV